jgi:two-component system NtrC family sensor kinase
MRAHRSRVVAKTSPAIRATPEGAAPDSGFEERYRLVCEAVAEGIYEWDIERNALSPSARLIEIFGFEGRSLGADDWNGIVHPHDFPIYRAALRDCFRGVTARLDCEYRVRHSDGAYRWIEDRALAVRDAAGRAIRLVGAVSDITERKEAEQALREALDRQTATAEILGVINSSPGDLAPVFNAILEKAHSLCGATRGSLLLYDGENFRAAAAHNYPEAFTERLRQGFRGADNPVTRPLLDGARFVQIPDLAVIDHPVPQAAASVGGFRTGLFVPLRRDDTLLGVITAGRPEVGLFADSEIALLENFAAQAVVAMENARLLTEQREALERQTATAKILRVISSSPTDVQPTFDAIARAATELSGATNGGVFRFDGRLIHFVAHHGWAPNTLAAIRGVFPLPPGRGSITARAILTRAVAHVADMAADPEFEHLALTEGGLHATLSVPMLRDGDPIGAITVTRNYAEPFSDRQIDLLKTFADQAVIAIENVRLFNELNERTGDLEESLEYQTATSDVLKVISQSTFDLEPVLQTVLDTAMRLCGNIQGSIFRLGEDGLYRQAVGSGMQPEYYEIEAQQEIRPGSATLVGRTAAAARPIQITDAWADPDYAPKEDARLGRLRSMLGVPLLREGTPIGVICTARTIVKPFTEKEIELVATFADQAVIAIENARLLGELRERTGDLEESLEYQTATSDVLKVISGSTFDIQPVFETIVATAMRLCGADFAFIAGREGEAYRVAATVAAVPEFDVFLRSRLWSGRETLIGRTADEGRVVHIADVAADAEFNVPQAIALGKMRTALGVPLLREGIVVGVIGLARERVQPFTERQIELVRTFADQAVIAIENARLINETREALERQTATAEILQVINSSPGELAPVFETILEKAHALCGATLGTLYLVDGQTFRPAAAVGYPEGSAPLREIKASEDPRLAVLHGGERLVHVADLSQLEDPVARAVAARGVRTNLILPLRHEGTLLGVITCNRHEVLLFAEKEIVLLENFAAQAVIAMENARLLNEIRQRQAELRVTIDNMGDGVAMFDAEMRLAAWNMNFQKILDLPDALLAERPTFQQYFEYLAGRGEYGAGDLEAQLRQTVADTRAESRFERTRPDGRVLEVRRNMVPGGGAVLMYGDITERKRAEAEIHTARDAAEAALRELKTAQANLIQAEKMASLGQLTAGIAHEIKNPLNFVNNFADLSVELLDELKAAAGPALAGLGEDARAEIDETILMLTSNLEKIAEHGRRADGIVRSMLEHSRGATGDRREVDLNGLVEEALNLAYHGARAQDQNFNITLEREFAAAIAPVELVPQDVTRVFLNLIGNGFYAANKRREKAGDARFKPILRVTTRELGDAVEVAVRDNGIGIGPELQDKLFQPFFTTKPTGEGTGLGLSISYDIVTQEHGGTITVDSRLGEFTEFTVRLPRAATAATSGGATTIRAASGSP